MIITIDGPAGAGKSSAAKALARRLDFEFLDTGAMYRAVTLALLRAGVRPTPDTNLDSSLREIRLEMPPGQVLLNGEDMTEKIRTKEVTDASGAVADHPAVRAFLVEQQRAIASGRDLVCEGRDQGTIVFPDAVCKFFLVAQPSERARRRQREMTARGEPIDVESILTAQETRDRRDAARAIAPMQPAADAIVVDSTHLTLEQVVDRLETHFREKTSRR